LIPLSVIPLSGAHYITQSINICYLFLVISIQVLAAFILLIFHLFIYFNYIYLLLFNLIYLF
jgi:hypothetical protein